MQRNVHGLIPSYHLPFAITAMLAASPNHPTVLRHMRAYEREVSSGHQYSTRRSVLQAAHSSFGRANQPTTPEHVRRCLRVFATSETLSTARFGLGPRTRHLRVKARSKRGWENGGKAYRALQATKAAQAAAAEKQAAKAARIEDSARYAKWREVYVAEHSKAALLDYRRDFEAYTEYREVTKEMPRLTWADWLAQRVQQLATV